MSTYDLTTNSVSFGVTVPDSTFDSDFFTMVFKTNTTEELYVGNPFQGMGGDNDMKTFMTKVNATIDVFTVNATLDGIPDEIAGGSEDTEGKMRYSSGVYTLEFSTSLDSGDTLGHDISLAENDQIEFTVMYYDNLITHIYTQSHVIDDNFDYCILKIGKPKLFGIETFALIASLISSMIISAVIKRKKKLA
ncbi:MAG: hypothetical protein ACTSO7_11345 [Candidatus Heimdallarchaeota archaeon]